MYYFVSRGTDLHMAGSYTGLRFVWRNNLCFLRKVTLVFIWNNNESEVLARAGPFLNGPAGCLREL